MIDIVNIPLSKPCSDCGMDWSKHPLSGFSCPDPTNCNIKGLHCHQLLISGGIKVKP